MGASRWSLGHSLCPATHTHTHTLHFRYTHSRPRCLLHTPTCTPYATHTSLLTASPCARLTNNALPAEREPGLAGQSALQRHPSSFYCLYQATATAAPDPREPTFRCCTLSAPEPYSITQILEEIFFLSLAKSHLGELREVLNDRK